MDAVYVVRAGDRNEELRYSLRSLRNLADIEQVWIAGYCPNWIAPGMGEIPIEQGRSKYANVKNALRAVVEHPDVSDEFAYFNDDFFVMQPMETLPILHRGTLREVVDAHHLSTPNSRAMDATYQLLREFGVEDPLCYDLHAPMPVTKAGMDVALAFAELVMPERSLFGNLAEIGGERAHNFKVYGAEDGWQDWPFLSTLDSSFRSNRVGAYIRDQFPDASEYEQ